MATFKEQLEKDIRALGKKFDRVFSYAKNEYSESLSQNDLTYKGLGTLPTEIRKDGMYKAVIKKNLESTVSFRQLADIGKNLKREYRQFTETGVISDGMGEFYFGDISFGEDYEGGSSNNSGGATLAERLAARGVEATVDTMQAIHMDAMTSSKSNFRNLSNEIINSNKLLTNILSAVEDKGFKQQTLAYYSESLLLLKEIAGGVKGLGVKEETKQDVDTSWKSSPLANALATFDVKELLKMSGQTVKGKIDKMGIMGMVEQMVEAYTERYAGEGGLKNVAVDAGKFAFGKTFGPEKYRRLEQVLDDPTKFFEELVQTSKFANNGFIRDLAERYGTSINTKLRSSTDKEDPKGKALFDNAAHTSIVTVIPTWLSKIYSAITQTSVQTYDYESNSYKTVDEVLSEYKSKRPDADMMVSDMIYNLESAAKDHSDNVALNKYMTNDRGKYRMDSDFKEILTKVMVGIASRGLTLNVLFGNPKALADELAIKGIGPQEIMMVADIFSHMKNRNTSNGDAAKEYSEFNKSIVDYVESVNEYNYKYGKNAKYNGTNLLNNNAIKNMYVGNSDIHLAKSIQELKTKDPVQHAKLQIIAGMMGGSGGSGLGGASDIVDVLTSIQNRTFSADELKELESGKVVRDMNVVSNLEDNINANNTKINEEAIKRAAKKEAEASGLSVEEVLAKKKIFKYLEANGLTMSMGKKALLESLENSALSSTPEVQQLISAMTLNEMRDYNDVQIDMDSPDTKELLKKAEKYWKDNTLIDTSKVDLLDPKSIFKMTEEMYKHGRMAKGMNVGGSAALGYGMGAMFNRMTGSQSLLIPLISSALMGGAGLSGKFDEIGSTLFGEEGSKKVANSGGKSKRDLLMKKLYTQVFPAAMTGYAAGKGTSAILRKILPFGNVLGPIGGLLVGSTVGMLTSQGGLFRSLGAKLGQNEKIGGFLKSLPFIGSFFESDEDQVLKDDDGTEMVDDKGEKIIKKTADNMSFKEILFGDEDEQDERDDLKFRLKEIRKQMAEEISERIDLEDIDLKEIRDNNAEYNEKTEQLNKLKNEHRKITDRVAELDTLMADARANGQTERLNLLGVERQDLSAKLNPVNLEEKYEARIARAEEERNKYKFTNMHELYKDIAQKAGSEQVQFEGYVLGSDGEFERDSDGRLVVKSRKVSIKEMYEIREKMAHEAKDPTANSRTFDSYITGQVTKKAAGAKGVAKGFFGGIGRKFTNFMDGADEVDIINKIKDVGSGSGRLRSGGSRGLKSGGSTHASQRDGSIVPDSVSSENKKWLDKKGCCVMATATVLAEILDGGAEALPGLIEQLNSIASRHIDDKNGDVKISFFDEVRYRMKLNVVVTKINNPHSLTKNIGLFVNKNSKAILLIDDLDRPVEKRVGHYIAITDVKGNKVKVSDPYRSKSEVMDVNLAGVGLAEYLIMIKKPGKVDKILKNHFKALDNMVVIGEKYDRWSPSADSETNTSSSGGTKSSRTSPKSGARKLAGEILGDKSNPMDMLLNRLEAIFDDGILVRGGVIDHVATTGVIGAVDQDLANNAIKDLASSNKLNIKGVRAVKDKIRFSQKQSRSKHGKDTDTQQDHTYQMDQENSENLKKIAENGGSGGNTGLMAALAVGMTGMMQMMTGIGAVLAGGAVLKGGAKSMFSGTKDIASTAIGQNNKSGIGVAKVRLGKHLLTGGAKILNAGKNLVTKGGSSVATNVVSKITKFSEGASKFLGAVGVSEKSIPGFIPKIAKWLSSLIEKILPKLGKIIPGEMLQTIVKNLNKIVDAIGGKLAQGLSKVVNKGLGLLGIKNAIGSTPLLGVAAVTMFVWDSLQGWRRADKILGVNKADLTSGMKAATAFASGLLSALSWVPGLGLIIAGADLVGFNGTKSIAEIIYKFFSKEDMRTAIRREINEKNSRDDSQTSEAGSDATGGDALPTLSSSEGSSGSGGDYGSVTTPPSSGNVQQSGTVAAVVSNNKDDVYNAVKDSPGATVSFDSSGGKGGNLKISGVSTSLVKDNGSSNNLGAIAANEVAKNTKTEISEELPTMGSGSTGGSSNSSTNNTNTSNKNTANSTASTVSNTTGLNSVKVGKDDSDLAATLSALNAGIGKVVENTNAIRGYENPNSTFNQATNISKGGNVGI